ncbi:uncharacterized protein TNCV_3005061 [Trichonephila clavipes]|nr:uncharacterized protein TNCV_3005061 [Trichonephila clavipes]
MSLVVAIFVIGLTSALPNASPSALEKKPDTTLPEQTMMGQTLKDLNIEICPDKLHLCPGTAECCKKDEGKWDCCPKAAVPIAGDCCNQLGFIWTCCTSLVPKCHWTAKAGSDVVQSGRLIFDDFFPHMWPYIGNNTANVVFQMVKRLWLIRIDQ